MTHFDSATGKSPVADHATLTEIRSVNDISNAALFQSRIPHTFLNYTLSRLMVAIAAMMIIALVPRIAIGQTCEYNGSLRAPESPCSLLCPQGLLYNLGTPRGATCGLSLGDGLRLHAYQDPMGYQPMPTIRFSYDKNELSDCTAERAGRIGIMPPRVPASLPNIAPFLFPVSLNPPTTIPPTVPPIENFSEGDVFLVSTCGAKDLLLATNNPEARIKFLTTPTTGLGTQKERMTILNNGNVGIGITSPGVQLHVSKAIMTGETGSGAGLTAYDFARRGVISLMPGSPGGSQYHIDNRDGTLSISDGGTPGDSPLGISDIMAFQGYMKHVGIGTNFASGTYPRNNYSGGSTSCTYAPAVDAKFVVSDSPVDAFSSLHVWPRVMRVERRNVSTSDNGIQSDYTLISAGHNTAETFVVKSNGKVNIGKSFIGTTHTDYLLSVSGKVVCNDLRVVPLSGNWPDYVFSASHKLMTLEEVEQSIKANQHLPGMPSAKEVEANGIDVGEMQRKLLEKMEEMTLYMIELKKENAELKAKIDAINQPTPNK